MTIGTIHQILLNYLAVKLGFKSVKLQNFQVFHLLETKLLVIEMDSTKAAEVIDCDTTGMRNAQSFLRIRLADKIREEKARENVFLIRQRIQQLLTQVPVGAEDNSGGNVANPSGNVANLGDNVGNPCGNVANPGGNVGNPGGNVPNPCGNVGNPGGNFGSPGRNVGNPGGILGNPGGNVGNPSGNVGNSGGNVGNPCGNVGNPGGNVANSKGNITSGGPMATPSPLMAVQVPAPLPVPVMGVPPAAPRGDQELMYFRVQSALGPQLFVVQMIRGQPVGYPRMVNASYPGPNLNPFLGSSYNPNIRANPGQSLGSSVNGSSPDLSPELHRRTQNPKPLNPNATIFQPRQWQ